MAVWFTVDTLVADAVIAARILVPLLAAGIVAGLLAVGGREGGRVESLGGMFRRGLKKGEEERVLFSMVRIILSMGIAAGWLLLCFLPMWNAHSALLYSRIKTPKR
jgi:hypothetical protein